MDKMNTEKRQGTIYRKEKLVYCHGGVYTARLLMEMFLIP